MAAETVETLELEIRTRATDAAETVARLATSVSDFGENISKYIGNLSNLASALKSIAESAKALDGVKNIKSVVSGAAMAAQKAKAVTIGKAFTPIVPPVKASSTVTGRTRNVSMNGGVYQYNQTADEIARQYNKSLQGTRYTNKDLSSKIQEIRQLILKGEEAAAMQMAKSLADELTSSSGQKAVHPLIERLNSAVEKGNAHKYIGVDERDIAGAGMTATEMDATLRSLGARFGVRRRNASKSYNTTHSIGSIEDFEDQMLEAGIPVSVEDLFYALKGQWSPQRNVRDEWTASSNEEMTERVFSSLIDDIYSGKTIDTNAPAAAAKAAAEMAQKAKEDAAQAAQYAKEAEAAWKQFEREESKANREYRSENKLNWKEVGWDVRDHARAEADVGTDNTAAEISEWNASEDERLLQYQEDLSEGWKQYAEEIVQAQTIAGKSLKDVIEDVAGLNSATKDAEDSARAMMDAMAGTTPFKSAEESAQVINAELDKAEREAEELRKAYRAPNRPGFHSYEEYTGPDNREFNMQATREFNELLGEIVQKENFIKNTKVHMIELSEAGIGNTSGVFARLKAANEAARLREAAGSISDAEREMTGLEGAARATAEEFMKDTTQADVLQMKLESVAQKLDEALNADEYDPGKIARLANEYQNLKGRIEKIGEAASNSSESASGLRSALSAVSNAIKHSSIGSLVSQLFRVAKMRGLRYIVRSLSSALSEGVSNLYNWSSGVNGSFASSMDTAASKLMLIKNSVATAFTPLIEQAVPYLSQLTSYVYTACNALSQFWALLTGSKTWTKALETTEKWSDSAKKGAGSAKEAAEETKDLLADWDELNIIQSETSSGGSGGGSGSGTKTDYSKMFEDTSVFDKWTEKFETIKGIVTAIGAGVAAWFVVDTVEDFLGKLGFAGDKVDSIFSKIKRGIVGAVLLKIGFELAEDVGEDIAENGLTWQNALEGIGSIVASGLGGSFVASAVGVSGVIGAITGIAVTVAVGLNAFIDKKREMTYARLAKNSFANVGKSGFDVEEYKAAVEKELNERIGTLSVTVSAFDTYGPAAEQLTKATSALTELGTYVYGDKKLTPEQAEAFKSNWDIVYQAMNQMHSATWDTINFGIADAMKGESEETRKYLTELQKELIEVQRLTGGAQAAWRTEMSQITGRIANNTASKEDLKRYSVLMELISDSDVSESLAGMKEWESTVKGFDFGSGEEAIQNALSFIGDMDGMYANATDEVNAWGEAQADAIAAAKKELEAYKNAGLIEEDDYKTSMAALDKWEAAYKDKVSKDLSGIEELKNSTYDQLFGQILEGAVVNKANGGSIDQYLEEVLPLLDELYQKSDKVRGLMEKYPLFTYGVGGIDFTGTLSNLANMFGTDYYEDYYVNGILPMLQSVLGDQYGNFMQGVFGYETPDLFSSIDPYEIKPTASPEDAFTFKTPDGFELKNGQFVPVIGKPEAVGIDVEANMPDGFVYGEDGKYSIETKDATINISVNPIKDELGDGDFKQNEDGTWEWTPAEKETVKLDSPKRIQEDNQNPIETELGEGDFNYNKDGTWEWTPTEKKTITLDVAPSLQETRDTVQEYFDENPIDLWFDEDTDDFSIEDVWDEPSASGNAGGNTAWFAGPSDESFEMDASASGLATDDSITGLANTTESGMNAIEALLSLFKSSLNNIETYTQQAANKDTTVVISPSSAFGRVTGNSQTQYGKVTGDFIIGG